MPKYQVFDADGNLIEEWETPDEPDPVVEVGKRVDAAEERLDAAEERLDNLEGGAG